MVRKSACTRQPGRHRLANHLRRKRIHLPQRASRRPTVSGANRGGFTLIELLVVIAIIAVLVAPPVAGGAAGAGIRPAVTVQEQPQADRPRLPQLSGRVRTPAQRRPRW